MRHILLTGTTLAALLATAMPALAQDLPVETRVGRLEKEMRAVQRKVFPGGTPIEPEITQAAPPPVAPSSTSTPIADLISRVDALENQMASITNQTEQNAYKLKQLEDAFAKYKAETDAKLSPVVAPPPVVPTQPGTGSAGGQASNGSGPRPAPISPQGNEERRTAVAAIERPQSGNAASDAYTYGFRLWDAKFFPEAASQLKATLDKYPSDGVASRTGNLLGRAYLDDGKPALAATVLYENYQKRPKGDRAADSLVWLGEALIQLKKPADACKVYGELQDVYGASLSSGLKTMADKGRTRAKCTA